MVTDPSYGLRFAADALGGLGLGDHWAYFDAHTGRWLGPGSGRARLLLLGRPAHQRLRRESPAALAPRRPPALRPDRHGPGLHPGRPPHGPGGAGWPSCTRRSSRSASRSRGSLRRPGRRPPLAGHAAAGPPLRLAGHPGPGGSSYTTVMQWDSYPPREYDGRRYGMKSESFGPYFDFPQARGRPLRAGPGRRSGPLRGAAVARLVGRQP